MLIFLKHIIVSLGKSGISHLQYRFFIEKSRSDEQYVAPYEGFSRNAGINSCYKKNTARREQIEIQIFCRALFVFSLNLIDIANTA